MKRAITTFIGALLLQAGLLASGAAYAQAAQPASDGQADPLEQCSRELGDQPRTALAPCLRSKRSQADAAMKKAYAEVERQLREINSAGTPQALASLQASQKSFQRFLKDECKRQGDAALGGSGAGDMELACRVSLTRWRTTSLLAQ